MVVLELQIRNLRFFLSCRSGILEFLFKLQTSCSSSGLFLECPKMLLNSEWNWGCLSRWLLNVHCRWMSEGEKLLQKLPGWMSEIGFFSVPFSVFWAKWELNLDEVKGVLKPRHPGERGLLCFDLGAGNELVCAPKPSRSSFLGWSWCLCVYYSN